MRHRHPSASPAFRSDFEPPPPLQTSGWRLAPLHPDLAQEDHDAWQSCRARLVRELQWGGWPSPDFTLADNRADLAEHYAEFERRQAFAYSVLAPDRCIGCVYIEPWTDGAQLAFWVIDDALPIEAEVVSQVLAWLDAWPFDRVVVPLRAENLRGRAGMESLGLEPCPGPEGHISYVRPLD